MQAALEITARYCRNEMEEYGRCVAASPASWQRDCHRLRLSMSRCAAAHPIVQQIRQDCAEPFAAFEQCLKENQASVMNCSDHVNAFLLCADQVNPVMPPPPPPPQEPEPLYYYSLKHINY
uniref:Coiled-coil-helix-coiled-coil-helix domain containing 5 n=1 Tax=Calidris pygmaea TaxID=425635 RepID=A0A8C3JUZ2_9CHAR